MKEPTILVIDDDAGVRDFLTSVLAPEGFFVSTANGGENGINQALALKPDLILLDLVMPGVNGEAVCNALRKNKQTKTIPIIVATGTTSTPRIENSIISGAEDFVSKPIDVEDLLIRIRAMLQCKDITDPIKRVSRYTDIVNEMKAKPHPPASPSL